MEQIPSVQEAEQAIEKVLLFVQAQGTGFLGSQELDLLRNVKTALFHAANGGLLRR